MRPSSLTPRAWKPSPWLSASGNRPKMMARDSPALRPETLPSAALRGEVGEHRGGGGAGGRRAGGREAVPRAGEPLVVDHALKTAALGAGFDQLSTDWSQSSAGIVDEFQPRFQVPSLRAHERRSSREPLEAEKGRESAKGEEGQQRKSRKRAPFRLTSACLRQSSQTHLHAVACLAARQGASLRFACSGTSAAKPSRRVSRSSPSFKSNSSAPNDAARRRLRPRAARMATRRPLPRCRRAAGGTPAAHNVAPWSSHTVSTATSARRLLSPGTRRPPGLLRPSWGWVQPVLGRVRPTLGRARPNAGSAVDPSWSRGRPTAHRVRPTSGADSANFGAGFGQCWAGVGGVFGAGSL